MARFDEIITSLDGLHDKFDELDRKVVAINEHSHDPLECPVMKNHKDAHHKAATYAFWTLVIIISMGTFGFGIYRTLAAMIGG